MRSLKIEDALMGPRAPSKAVFLSSKLIVSHPVRLQTASSGALAGVLRPLKLFCGPCCGPYWVVQRRTNSALVVIICGNVM
jgi:hypothetical protein